MSTTAAPRQCKQNVLRVIIADAVLIFRVSAGKIATNTIRSNDSFAIFIKIVLFREKKQILCPKTIAVVSTKLFFPMYCFLKAGNSHNTQT